MFRININYDTGDSFRQFMGEEGLLEYDFNTPELAKEAIDRIKEHYEWYQSLHHNYSWGPKPQPKPKWHNIGFNKSQVEEENMLNLNVWSGKENKVVEVIFWPFWIGYFESLNYAEIVGDRVTI